MVKIKNNQIDVIFNYKLIHQSCPFRFGIWYVVGKYHSLNNLLLFLEGGEVAAFSKKQFKSLERSVKRGMIFKCLITDYALCLPRLQLSRNNFSTIYDNINYNISVLDMHSMFLNYGIINQI